MELAIQVSVPGLFSHAVFCPGRKLADYGSFLQESILTFE
jgi:hypothetical protein